MIGTALRERNMVPLRLMPSTLSHISFVSSATAWFVSMTPALLHSTSRRPYVSTALSMILSQSLSNATFPSMPEITPPAAVTSSTTCLSDSAFHSAATTFAPSAAKRAAIARPIPEPAPVITATLSASLIWTSPIVLRSAQAVLSVPGHSSSADALWSVYPLALCAATCHSRGKAHPAS